MTCHVLNALALLKSKEWIDLTHTFSEETPHFSMFQPAKFETTFDYSDGFFVKNYTFAGQYGTHIDPPSHFIEHARSADELDLKELVLPLIVIDQSERAKRDPQFSISKVDILNFELKHGKIPEGAFVALRTDWSKRWPSQVEMENKDTLGKNQTPGWALDALKFLFEKRKIKAIGHETFDTDASKDVVKYKKFKSEHYVLSQNTYQIELMNNLDLLPPKGAVIFNIVAKPKNSPGFPVRSFAILP